MAMHILQGFEDLEDKRLDSVHRETETVITVFQDFQDSLFNIFKHDVEFFIPFEGFLEPDDVLMS